MSEDTKWGVQVCRINPLFTGGTAVFSFYQIAPVREWHTPDGSEPYSFCEPCMDAESMEEDADYAAGPVFYTLYGRIAVGERRGCLEAIADRDSLDAAVELLDKMIGREAGA